MKAACLARRRNAASFSFRGTGSTMASAIRRNSVILVVEDVEEIREMLVDFLSDAGYGVLAASGADVALERLEEAAPADLLFTDIILGSMNGLRLAREAIMLRPQLRVLYATGYALPVQEKEP